MDDIGASPAAVAKGLVKFNPGYLTTLPGILKIVQFVLLLLSWALCSGFKNGHYNIDVASDGSMGFFLFVTVILWIIVVIIIVMGLLSLLDKLRLPMKMLILAIIYGAAAVLLLISSAIIGGDAASITKGYCAWIKAHTSTTCATYEAAAAFGIFSCLAFIIDAVLHFFNHRNQGPSVTV